jgi:hypothetical protein
MQASVWSGVSTTTLAGVLLIGLPPASNASFAVLSARFDYPEVAYILWSLWLVAIGVTLLVYSAACSGSVACRAATWRRC